jgi:hypothetical protein
MEKIIIRLQNGFVGEPIENDEIVDLEVDDYDLIKYEYASYLEFIKDGKTSLINLGITQPYDGYSYTFFLGEVVNGIVQ